MNRDSAKKLWPIVKAFGDGKAIMCNDTKYDEPDADLAFNSDPSYYTIAPEPKYRPFKNAEEFAPNRNRWIINKNNQIGHSRIVWFNDKGVKLASFERLFNYEELFDAGMFAVDGSPCGGLNTEGGEG